MNMEKKWTLEKQWLLAGQWEKVLQPFFPGARVFVYEASSPYCDVPVLDVFYIPDDMMGDFTLFMIHQFSQVAEDNRLPEADLISHSVSATREHYPEIWAQLNGDKATVDREVIWAGNELSAPMTAAVPMTT